MGPTHTHPNDVYVVQCTCIHVPVLCHIQRFIFVGGNFGEKLKINLYDFMARHVHVNLILQVLKYTHIPMKLVQGVCISMSSCHERVPHSNDFW